MMRVATLPVTGFAAALALLAGASLNAAYAQSRTAVPPAQRTAAAPPPVQKCLRALNGACVNRDIEEAARRRAAIIPSVRVSYYGTPAGTIGGRFITFERLFQDNDVLFGLPTSTCTTCIITRSK